MKNPVTDAPAAAPEEAIAHFERRLRVETDCADVHQSMAENAADFFLLDVRGPNAFARGHIPGAQNLPHAAMDAERMAEFPAESLFVVYCAGPHCNGANRAAVRLARLGLPVKEMIGGITGWQDEGFDLETGASA
ncbi:rhodanese-like domain-containing protein [Denitrobaculum tricleocarpae]|uniref:Rhodanese-like domain-containing protein n=1 Tax=Denitrobaculum tricleocarpae TaxID=2591009 RepID=A0A545TF40_9PROT|nr:rhodanese-like domain-containing protein [Denitrobaculum tricleocarpae]TQV75847.1 rhodanese-like domain-containing protein [Denitrobaculum tricleocarpae]